MIGYLIQTIAFQLLFLILYELLLKKETFFQWNRAYLCFTPLLALILPFIKIPALQTAIPQNFVVALPEITIGNTTATQNTIAATNPSFALFEIILLTGIALSTMLFLWKLYKIRQLKRKGKTEISENITIIHLPKSTEAFSFAGAIYIGEHLSIHAKEQIIQHEQVHIKQKHYADLLYFELLRILFWFNPLIYIFQKRTATLHEYIADAETVSLSDKKEYYQNLLSEVFQTQNISFINTFFNHSLIKKRIVMLHKSKSKKSQLVKYALLLPVLAGMLFYTSCTQEIETPSKESSVTQKIEELKMALENNESGLTVSESNELYELVKNAPLKGVDERNAISLFNQGELDALPFAVIDQVPVYPGCENLATNEERKNCMAENINNLVIENFNKDIFDEWGIKGRARITVQFKIDTQGNVVDIFSRAPNNFLQEEAKRVISLIPKMQPGKQDGKDVSVLYSVPIVFEIKN